MTTGAIAGCRGGSEVPATTEHIWAMAGALGLPGVSTLGLQIISPGFLLSSLSAL